VNDELVNISKEVVVALFKLLSRHSPKETEVNHENLSYDSRSPVRDLNPGHSEYEV
jgi:hypothetical protein